MNTQAQYPVMTIAHYVITRGFHQGRPLSNLQLQKILYFLQKDYLKTYGRPLYQEPIEAWLFGPVVRKVYFAYCAHGSNSILREYETEDLEEMDKIFIDPLIDKYRSETPWELVAETHKEGSAWSQIWNNGKGRKKEIPLDLIRTENI